MSYLLPLVLAIAFNTVDKVIARSTLRKNVNPDSYLLVYQVVCLAISLPAAILALIFSEAGERTGSFGGGVIWLFVVLAMAAWSLFGVATFRSSSKLDLSVSATIGTSKLLWAALLGIVFFHESLGPLHIVGLAVIVVANLALHRFPFNRMTSIGALYAAVAAFALSGALALDKWLLDYLDAAVVLCLGFAGSTITSLVLNRKSSRADLRVAARSAVLAAIAGSAGYYFLLVAMRMGDLSVVVPIYQSSHIFFVAAGILILKERMGMRPKLVAAIASTVGAILIFAGSS